jgi:hypothetical protein
MDVAGVDGSNGCAGAFGSSIARRTSGAGAFDTGVFVAVGEAGRVASPGSACVVVGHFSAPCWTDGVGAAGATDGRASPALSGLLTVRCTVGGRVAGAGVADIDGAAVRAAAATLASSTLRCTRGAEVNAADGSVAGAAVAAMVGPALR